MAWEEEAQQFSQELKWGQTGRRLAALLSYWRGGLAILLVLVLAALLSGIIL